MRRSVNNEKVDNNKNNKKVNKKFSFKKFSIYFISFLCIGTLITVTGLKLADDFLYKVSNSEVVLNNSNDKNTTKKDKILKLDNNIDVQYSYNNKYYTYIKDGNIQIYNVDDNKLFTTIDEKDEIVFYNLIYDKNLILYFTKDKNKIVLNTYDVATKRDTVYNKITVNNFSKIKQIEFSPIINVVLVNVETKVNNKISNTVYRFNLFNDMNVVSSNKVIDRIVMLKQKETIYYVYENGSIYQGGSKLNLFKDDVDIIGTDIDDKIYFINKSKSKVYVVKNNKILKTIELTDKDVVKFYTNNYDVYLMYSTYLIKISDDDPLKKIAKLSDFVSVDAIKEDTIYLRTKDNNVIVKKIGE